MEQPNLNTVFNNPELNKKEIKKQRNLVEAGYSPIRCSLIDMNNIDAFSKEKIKEIKQNGVHIDFYGNRLYDRLQDVPFYRGLDDSYVISYSNSDNKFSQLYYNCTGVILAGQSKNSSKEFSLLTHQNPYQFLDKRKKDFEKDLKENVDDFLSQVKPESVDAIIFGGSIDLGEYKDSLKLLNRILKKQLGFEPTVITGPDLTDDNPTSVFFETQTRHLYLVRSEQKENTANQSFIPSDYPEKSRNWQYFRKK